jgi:plasmid stability protein
MRSILIRQLPAEAVESLQRRAKSRARSMQQELRRALQRRAESDAQDGMALAEAIQRDLRATGRVFPDSTPLFREDRENR